MPDKLTDNEIIKTLNEADGMEHISVFCADGKGENMKSIPMVDIVDLINRQKAENTGKNIKIRRLEASIKDFIRINNEQEQEIESLKDSNRILLNKLCKKIDKKSKAVEKIIKAEAYKEFAEEIENINLSNSDDYFEFKRSRFDNLLNELVGEDNAECYD